MSFDGNARRGAPKAEVGRHMNPVLLVRGFEAIQHLAPSCGGADKLCFGQRPVPPERYRLPLYGGTCCRAITVSLFRVEPACVEVTDRSGILATCVWRSHQRLRCADAGVDRTRGARRSLLSSCPAKKILPPHRTSRTNRGKYPRIASICFDALVARAGEGATGGAREISGRSWCVELRPASTPVTLAPVGKSQVQRARLSTGTRFASSGNSHTRILVRPVSQR
jgi:hypothetical protein